ncbi:MAG: 5-(carboxyamino)imidazole ribonucleotide synthase [Planctomycetota bacterium]
MAQMLGSAARRLGVRCRALDPSPDACAARTCELITGAYDDPAAIARLVEGVDALTFEFENVPTSALAEAARLGVTVLPKAESLRVASDRLVEKRLFESVGMRVPPYRSIETANELIAAVREIGVPLLLKARSGGYDGRSQAIVRETGDAEQAWAVLGNAPCLVETMVDLSYEISVIACRGADGQTEVYPLAKNEHRGGILVRSIAPAQVDTKLAEEAHVWAADLLKRLDYVGVIALELFVSPDGLLANEFAPRVHNTGHSTIEGNETSQFENHVRAVLGMELGSAAPSSHAIMRNFIGSMPISMPDPNDPCVFLHDYGKAPAQGRKLGHVTIIGATPSEAIEREARVIEELASGRDERSLRPS